MEHSSKTTGNNSKHQASRFSQIKKANDCNNKKHRLCLQQAGKLDCLFRKKVRSSEFQIPLKNKKGSTLARFARIIIIYLLFIIIIIFFLDFLLRLSNAWYCLAWLVLQYLISGAW